LIDRFAAFSFDLTPIVSTNQIAFYGLGLNNSIILQAIGFGTPPGKGVLGVYQNLRNVCVGNLILSAAGLIPGYYFTFLFIDKWGRKPIQLMGFIMLAILFIILGEFFASFFSCSFPSCLPRFRLSPAHQDYGNDESLFLPVLPRKLLPKLRS
jgi:hypothetical protein